MHKIWSGRLRPPNGRRMARKLAGTPGCTMSRAPHTRLRSNMSPIIPASGDGSMRTSLQWDASNRPPAPTSVRRWCGGDDTAGVPGPAVNGPPVNMTGYPSVRKTAHHAPALQNWNSPCTPSKEIRVGPIRGNSAISGRSTRITSIHVFIRVRTSLKRSASRLRSRN
jgi:hypothetical protein